MKWTYFPLISTSVYLLNITFFKINNNNFARLTIQGKIFLILYRFSRNIITWNAERTIIQLWLLYILIIQFHWIGFFFKVYPLFVLCKDRSSTPHSTEPCRRCRGVGTLEVGCSPAGSGSKAAYHSATCWRPLDCPSWNHFRIRNRFPLQHSRPAGRSQERPGRTWRPPWTYNSNCTRHSRCVIQYLGTQTSPKLSRYHPVSRTVAIIFRARFGTWFNKIMGDTGPGLAV